MVLFGELIEKASVKEFLKKASNPRSNWLGIDIKNVISKIYKF